MNWLEANAYSDQELLSNLGRLSTGEVVRRLFLAYQMLKPEQVVRMESGGATQSLRDQEPAA